VVVTVLVASFFMWIGAKVARIEKATFDRAILASIGSTVIGVVMAVTGSVIPVAGNAIGFVLGLICSVFVIQGVFGTSFGKALLIWVFNLIAQTIGAVLVFVVGFGVLTAMA
jgi:hypothetical protein